MELTKESIGNIKFKSKRKAYYYAMEVDKCLDDIAQSADELQAELAALRSKVGDYEKNYERSRAAISEAMISAQQTAALVKAQAETEKTELLQDALAEKDSLDSSNAEAGRMFGALLRDIDRFYRDTTDELNSISAKYGLNGVEKGEEDQIVKIV